jgi:dGTPase
MLIKRQRREKIEEMTLAPYATLSGRTQGRDYAEGEPEFRTVFQRDRDRILHTTAFRRLEYKTQVFVNLEGDYYRTRLTHTLEVAQIGRSLANALGVNQDLVEAICLVHDLGHPAFGHAGEETLNHLMADHGGFDHNKQTLRIVTKLERRYPDFRGLNLTYEVREGIIKHETEYDTADNAVQGYAPELRGSLEAQLANVADELAYNAHDLDDGLRAGVLEVWQLENLELWRTVRESIGWAQDERFTDLIRHRMIRRLIGLQIADVIRTMNADLEASAPGSLMELQQMPRNIKTHSEDFERMNRELKTFLFKKMYRHYRVVRMATKAERVLTELFRAYVAEPYQMPDSYQQRLADHPVYRVVTDYLAGMTDRYALQEYQKLFTPFVRT